MAGKCLGSCASHAQQDLAEKISVLEDVRIERMNYDDNYRIERIGETAVNKLEAVDINKEWVYAVDCNLNRLFVVDGIVESANV